MSILQLTTSIKREYWEFRRLLFWVPLTIGILIMFVPLIQYLLLEDYQTKRLFEGLTQMQDLPNPADVSRGFFAALTAVFMPFLWIALLVQLHYFTNCLYDERRDLSILFWRSMPVSDALNVGAKFITGALVIPVIFMFAATLTLLILLLLALILTIVLSVGYDTSLWALWADAQIITNLASLWLTILPYTLWVFPIYAWLMLASMFASKAPFLWAILPIVILILIEMFVVKYFGLSSMVIMEMLIDYISLSDILRFGDISHGDAIRMVPFNILLDKVAIGPILLGSGLMGLTYLLRVKRSNAC